MTVRTAGYLAVELMSECDPEKPVLLRLKFEDGSMIERDFTGADLFVRNGQMRICIDVAKMMRLNELEKVKWETLEATNPLVEESLRRFEEER